MVLSILNSMRQRMSWSDARVILKMAGIEPGQGWNKTIEKIGGLPVPPELGPLEDRLVEHNLCGDKFTKLYSMRDEARFPVHAKIAGYSIADTAATEHFPKALPEHLLSEHMPGFVPIAIETNDDGIGLVLSSAFQMKKREDIDFEEFDDPAEFRARYDEIVGVTYRWVQILSVIWVPHHRNCIELRVDFPKGMTQDAIHAFHSRLREHVNRWDGIELESPINLFPAVRKFYDDKKEGRITEIMFSTTTGGIKNEKILRRRGNLDQRDEAYHLAGKAGLADDIYLYRTTVEWTIPVDNLWFKPTVTLAASGPSGKGPGGSPTISGAYIGGCVRAADYEFVIERLENKVQQDL